MSEELKQFLSDYLAWVEAGAPPSKPFERGYGLCSNTYHWDGDWTHLGGELDTLFAEDGLDEDYPFGEAAYAAAIEADTQHLHQPRIDWIVRKLAAAQGINAS
jgi:hypothetical protein